ncbi:hypothetical protein CEB3_c14170 [Peptococcaceae bacterium CEB3]|nr:hypothetical protein CEB3_c14170 [Peptococcaceae bacterium CEB3]
MTKVKVLAGACGFTTMIDVIKLDRSKVEISVDSPCEMVQAFSHSLPSPLQWMKVFAKVKDSLVFEATHDNLKHSDCPVPVALIKAVMVEMGAMLPKDATIVFIKEDC